MIVPADNSMNASIRALIKSNEAYKIMIVSILLK
jgi:hypothetical protein